MPGRASAGRSRRRRVRSSAPAQHGEERGQLDQQDARLNVAAGDEDHEPLDEGPERPVRGLGVNRLPAGPAERRPEGRAGHLGRGRDVGVAAVDGQVAVGQVGVGVDRERGRRQPERDGDGHRQPERRPREPPRGPPAAEQHEPQVEQDQRDADQDREDEPGLRRARVGQDPREGEGVGRVQPRQEEGALHRPERGIARDRQQGHDAEVQPGGARGGTRVRHAAGPPARSSVASGHRASSCAWNASSQRRTAHGTCGRMRRDRPPRLGG